VTDRVVIDTGPIVALFSKGGAAHRACIGVLSSLRPPLLTSWPVLTEAHWLLKGNRAVLSALFAALHGGLILPVEMKTDAVEWVEKLLLKYRSIGAQLADATVMYLAEVHGTRTVFTLDYRDFSMFRTAKRQSLRIIPAKRS